MKQLKHVEREMMLFSFFQENVSTQEKFWCAENNRLLNRMARVSVSLDNDEDMEEARYKKAKKKCANLLLL